MKTHGSLAVPAFIGTVESGTFCLRANIPLSGIGLFVLAVLVSIVGVIFQVKKAKPSIRILQLNGTVKKWFVLRTA